MVSFPLASPRPRRFAAYALRNLARTTLKSRTLPSLAPLRHLLRFAMIVVVGTMVLGAALVAVAIAALLATVHGLRHALS